MNIFSKAFFVSSSTLVAAVCWAIFTLIPTATAVCNPPPGSPANAPIGVPFGPRPGRVSWAHNPDCCKWDGHTHFWWNHEFNDQAIIDQMVTKAVASVAGVDDIHTAWDTLFRFHNQRKSGVNAGYKKGEKISIKMNLNVNYLQESGTSPLANSNSVSPMLVKALVRSMVRDGGIPEEDIFPYDSSRFVMPFFYEPPTGLGDDFPNLKFVDRDGNMNYTIRAVPDPDTGLAFSEKITDWNKTLFPTIMTQSKYHMNIAAFRGHTHAGVTSTFKNYFGSIYRPDVTCNFEGLPSAGHWCPGQESASTNIHNYITATEAVGGNNSPKYGSYNPFVDLMGSKHTGGKLVLALIDGLYGGNNQGLIPHPTGIWPPIKFQSSPFNNWWTSSVFASVDPVALESVGFDFLRTEPLLNNTAGDPGCIDNHLHEAALCPNPPSRTQYDPDKNGKGLSSLGVHEHWNNAIEKKYSRNLGTANGIELVQV